MKTRFLSILFIIFCLTSSTQTILNPYELHSLVHYYTVDSDTFSGQYLQGDARSGYLKQFRSLVYKRKSIHLLIPFDSLQYDYVSQHEVLYEGRLKEGVHIDRWIRYYTSGSYYEPYRDVWGTYQIDYKKDTIISSRRFLHDLRRITYITYSNEVFGYVAVPFHRDILNFKCRDKKRCVYWIDSEDQVIDSSNYSDLRTKLLMYEAGL